MHVAQCKSFTKSAVLLDTPVSTVSKKITWLENYLGAQLFIRTTRTLSLTEKGHQLYLDGQEILSQWENVRDNISDENKEISGIIRIDTSPRFDDFVLMEVITEFLTLHPKVKIHHRDVSEASDMETSGTDIYMGIRPPMADDTKLVKKELLR